VEAHRVARSWSSYLSRQSTHRRWWDYQPYAPAALYSQEDSWYSFLLEAESTPGRLEGLDQLKNPVTSSGIKSATFRLVAQCFKQLRYRVLAFIHDRPGFCITFWGLGQLFRVTNIAHTLRFNHPYVLIGKLVPWEGNLFWNNLPTKCIVTHFRCQEQKQTERMNQTCFYCLIPVNEGGGLFS
jgi:hypothetical protein